VQSLSGGNSASLSERENTYSNCTINLLTETSSLDEVGHNNGTIYVATGMSTDSGEVSLGGITLRDPSSGSYLLRGGASSYTIVKPAANNTTINKAASELVKYFKEATGITLPVITDSARPSHSNLQTYISLGATTLYTSADLDSPDITADGCYLYTKDSNLYIEGGDVNGVLNGVYELLADLFDLEFYYVDYYTINTGVREVELNAYDNVINPDIALRGQPGIGAVTAGTSEDPDGIYSDYALHLRSNDYYWAYVMPVHNAYDETKADRGHNSLYYLPAELYKSSHPNFYSNQSTWASNDWGGVNAQLCYTARGNATEYNTMVTLCAERIEDALKRYKNNSVYNGCKCGGKCGISPVN